MPRLSGLFEDLAGYRRFRNGDQVRRSGAAHRTANLGGESRRKCAETGNRTTVKTGVFAELAATALGAYPVTGCRYQSGKPPQRSPQSVFAPGHQTLHEGTPAPDKMRLRFSHAPASFLPKNMYWDEYASQGRSTAHFASNDRGRGTAPRSDTIRRAIRYLQPVRRWRCSEPVSAAR